MTGGRFKAHRDGGPGIDAETVAFFVAALAVDLAAWLIWGR